MKKFNINDFYDVEKYEEVLNQLMDDLERLEFDFESVIELQIDKKKLKLKLGRFLYNLIMLKPFFKLNREVTEEYLVLGKFSKNHFNEYMESLIEIFNTEEDIEAFKDIVLEIIENISDVTGLVNYIKGNTIDLFSLVDLSIESKEFDKLMHYKIDESLTINEAEKDLKKATDKAIAILKIADTSLRPFLLSGVGVKEKQLRESFISVGYRPNLRGDIIEKPINNSLIAGLSSAEDYANMAIGSRKALIINHINVKRSGYLTRKLLLLMVDSGFSHEEDCESQHYLQVAVRSEFVLKNLHGRWIFDKKSNELVQIHKEDKEYIGTVVNLRSPISCACKDGKVCKTCYGDLLYQVNKDKHPGILATLLLTNPFTQNLLSSKHMLKVSVDEIAWSDEIQDHFDISKDTLRPKIKDDDEVLSFSIGIDKESLLYNENNSYYIKEFHISKGRNTPKKVISPIALFLNENLVLELEANGWDTKIHSSLLVDGCFDFITENKEFSKSLDKINSVLDNNNHYIDSQNIHKVYNFFIKLLEINNISISLAHIEMIFKPLVRKLSNHVEPLDFTLDELEDYTILRVSTAIMKSGSPSLSLSFEKIQTQLNNPEFYELTNSSRLDEFFIS